MDEIVIMLVLGVLGFVIGGFVGLHYDHSWAPDCWYGLCIALGGPVIIHTGCDHG